MSVVASLIGPVSTLLGKVIKDKDKAAALAHEISTLASKQALELAKGQMEINKIEAAHASIFVSGWRPALGWVCTLGMFGNFITIPFSNFVLALIEVDVVIPLVPLETMMPVLMGMLGLGAMRSFEKTRK